MEKDIVSIKRKALTHYFSKLNPQQLEAVLRVNGPVLVLAGAGSGKTTAIINRIVGMIQFGNAWFDASDTIFPDDLDYLEQYIADNAAEDLTRLREILAVNPIPAWKILAITFTNKAAGELRTRLEQKLSPEDASSIHASTFHSACVRILRRSIEQLNLGYSSSFTIYDSDDAQRLIKHCIADLDISEKQFPAKSVISEISHAKDAMLSPEMYADNAGNDYRKSIISRIYTVYQERLRQANALDFDDLIYLTVRLFEQVPEELSYYQNRFRYIMVDEYQDTNVAQFRLIQLLANRWQNLCVVGDDDQSIYRFRGATIENILSFEKHFPGSSVIRLEQNYRSTQNILDAANAVIANNTARKSKQLWTNSDAGDLVTWYRAASESEEAEFVAKTITQRVADGSRYRDFAILYRMNAQSNALERLFIRNNIPYRIHGGTRFYDRKEIKDILAYMCVIENPYDVLRFQRIVNVPKRGIGDATLGLINDIIRDLNISPIEAMRDADFYPILSKKNAPLKKFAAMIEQLAVKSKEMPLNEFVDVLLEETGYAKMLSALGDEGEMRLENVEELKSSMLQYMKDAEEPTLSGFLEEIALFTDVDHFEEETDTVTMMTVHSAKGLEFENVFLVGFEENVFPGTRAINSVDLVEMEEERRLAYVAITRAKHHLYLSTAERRTLFGMTTSNIRSRFIGEITPALIEKKSYQKNMDDSEKENKVGFLHSMTLQEQIQKQRTQPRKADAKSKSFQSGERVRHNIFGEGTVLAVTPMANDFLIEVAFDRVGTKKLMANFAKIQKL